MMKSYKNIKEFVEKFIDITDRLEHLGDISPEEDHFIYYWEANLAMAIIRDLDNKGCVRDIAKIMLAAAGE